MSLSGPSQPSSRAIALLFFTGVLALFAGLAGLAATSIPAPGQENLASLSPLHPARIGGKYGYADASGRLIIPARFDMADTFADGLALVRERGRFGYVDAHGSLAIPAVFRYALPFRDGYAAVRNGNEWIYLDRVGRPVTGRPASPGPLAGNDSGR